jgi:acyl CoA:acetate/3-ketoacid CoA transferase alpha subunit
MRTFTVEDAVALIPEGATLMIGGFMGVGSPDQLIDETYDKAGENFRSSPMTPRCPAWASESL